MWSLFCYIYEECLGRNNCDYTLCHGLGYLYDFKTIVFVYTPWSSQTLPRKHSLWLNEFLMLNHVFLLRWRNITGPHRVTFPMKPPPIKPSSVRSLHRCRHTVRHTGRLCVTWPLPVALLTLQTHLLWFVFFCLLLSAGLASLFLCPHIKLCRIPWLMPQRC